MANNQWSPWSVKYREMVNETKGISSDASTTSMRNKKDKTKMAFQTTLDAVRSKENEPEKSSDKKSGVSDSKRAASPKA